MTKYSVGIDVGGTNVKFGLIDNAGSIIARSTLSTKNYASSKKKLINALNYSIGLLIKDIKKSQVSGVGIGLPGLINSKEGVVNFLPNVPGWKNVPLKRIMQDELKIPVCIDNDVNLITLGEWKFGAGKTYKNLVCMTLGTGVGSGLILNNRIYRGEGFAAGELGHMPLNEKGLKCSCGGEACFETYVGNRVLTAKAAKLFKLKNIRLEEVYVLAEKGNVRAVQFWQEAAMHIGNALVGLVNLLNPRLIIIGGGVSNNYKYLGQTISKIVSSRCMNVQAKMVKIVRSKLGDDAGIIGAHVLVKEGKVE